MKQALSWAQFDAMAADLAGRLGDESPFDLVVGVARGGLPLAVELSHRLDCRHFGVVLATRTVSEQAFSVGDQVGVSAVATSTPTARRILIVDDIIGSGRTSREIRNRLLGLLGDAIDCRFAALYADTGKITQVYPDLMQSLVFGVDVDNTKVWIDFPWERGPA